MTAIDGTQNTIGATAPSSVGFADTRPVFVSGAARPGIAVSSWTGQGDVHDPLTWTGPFKIAESNDFQLAGPFLSGGKHEGDAHVFGDFKGAWFKDPDGNILHVNNM